MRPTIFTIRTLNYIHVNGLVGQHLQDIPAEVCPPDRVQIVARELMQLEMIPQNTPMAGGIPIAVLPRCAFDAERIARAYPRIEAQWLLLEAADARPNDAGVYDALQGRQVGEREFTERDIQKASRDLEAHGYLEAGSTSNYRPILTSAGEDLVAAFQTPFVWPPDESGFSVTNNYDNSVHQSVQARDGVNVAQAAHHGTATLTVTERNSTEVFEALERLRQGLRVETSASDAAAVAGLLTRLEAIEEQLQDAGEVPSTMIERFWGKALEVLASESAQRVLPLARTLYVLAGLPPLTA